MKNPCKTIFVLLALVSAAANAQDEQADKVTALFEHLNVGMQPGAAVMVIKDGGVVYSNGFGWRLDQHCGHRRIAHGGTWVGFRTGIARFPDEKLTIVVLTNRTDGNPDSYIENITDIYLPESGDDCQPVSTLTRDQLQRRRRHS